MRVFQLREPLNEEYEHTLFAQLAVVDDRNPSIASINPIPPESRVMAFRTAPRFSVWPVHRLDGSPDFRFNPSIVGGGDRWITLQRLMGLLEKAEAKGDVFADTDGSSVPVSLSRWRRGDEITDVALFTAVEGWTLPLYFKSGFQAFARIMQSLRDLNKQIADGTADSIEVDFG